MEPWCVVLIAGLIALFAAIFLLTLSPALLLNKIVFGRQDKDPDYKYFTAEDFGLTCEEFRVELYGTPLSSHIYSVKPVEQCERVVVFQHGFGAGSSSYMTEIAHFAKAGFAVIATDAYGCNNSAGKSVKGFYAGAEAVIATYTAVNCDERLKNKKIALVGHSWGAYSVLAACGRISPDAVVAVSGFDAPAQCLCDQIKNLGGKLGKLVAALSHGWFWLFNFFKFGKNGNTRASKFLKKSGVKALIIHGEKDGTVIYKHSAAAKCGGQNVQTIILPDKRHNPYNTVAAEDKLKELISHKNGDGEFYNNFDWSAATEKDAEVMSAIDSFIKEV